MKQAELFEHQNSVIAKLRCNILKEDDIIKQISMQSKKSKNDLLAKCIAKPKAMISSARQSVVPKATTGKSVQIISRSRIAILGKLSSVPIFSDTETEKIPSSFLGHGQFGSVSVVKLIALNVFVAAKELDIKRASRKAILGEVVVMLSLSSNRFFPFCYRLHNDNVILM